MLEDQFHSVFFQAAFEEAYKALDDGEVPVGAIVTRDQKIIGRGHNQVINKNSVCAHAEIQAIKNASSTINNYRLIDCNIYVTLEPCHMCAKAIVDARIKNLFFSCLEPKTGSIISIDNFLDKPFLNHKVKFEYGYNDDLSSSLLKNFFLTKRKNILI